MVAMNASRPAPVIVATLLRLVSGYHGTARSPGAMGLPENPPWGRTARARDCTMRPQGEHIHRWNDPARLSDYSCLTQGFTTEFVCVDGLAFWFHR